MNDSFSPYESAIDSISAKFGDSSADEAKLTRLLMHIGGGLGVHFDCALKQHQLNYTTWTALVVIYSHGGHRIQPSELSTHIQTSRTHCTRIADDLASKGWVERVNGAGDRREVYVQLTPAGLTLVETLLPERRKQYRALWAGFSAQETQQLEQLLRKLLQQLDG